jgi:hypothetical protein
LKINQVHYPLQMMEKWGMQAIQAMAIIQVMNDVKYNLMFQVLYFWMFFYKILDILFSVDILSQLVWWQVINNCNPSHL